MQKVLFLIESLGGGGAEKVLDTLVRHIDRDRFDVTLCPVVDTGCYAESLRGQCGYHPLIAAPHGALGRFWYKLKYHLIYHWLPLWFVYRLFVPKGNDVEVAFCEGFATRLLAHSSNKTARKLAWLHTDLHNFHYTRRFFKNDDEEAWCYSRYDHIVAVSQTARDAFHVEFPSVTTPVTTIYNPIDIDAIRRAAAEQVELPPKPQGVMRLVTTGRLVQVKGYDRLLRVAKRLLDEGHKIELWILGEGDQRAALERQIADSGLGSCVRLWGFQRNPYVYLAASDIFVCSSRAEGYSTAATEAIIVGLPVVTTECSGMNELLEDGKCGIIVANDDDASAEGGLQASITRLLTDNILLDQYRCAATNRGEAFSLDATLQQVESLIDITTN